MEPIFFLFTRRQLDDNFKLEKARKTKGKPLYTLKFWKNSLEEMVPYLFWNFQK